MGKESGSAWLGWGLLFIGIAFLWSSLDASGTNFYYDLVRPLGDAFGLSPLWWLAWRLAELVIMTFWPLVFVYFGWKQLVQPKEKK